MPFAYFCTCDWPSSFHGHSYDGTQYLTCINRECPQFDVSVLPPRLAVEHADPAVVRRVPEETERERREAEHREEEENMRELLAGGRPIFRRHWNRRGSTTTRL